jgi:hypothetical protein
VLDDAGTIVLHDTRYFVTSLAPELVSASRLLQYVRDHWQVEVFQPECPSSAHLYQRAA